MKSLLLIFSLLLGIVFPQAHIYSFLINYLLMTILFFTFLDIKPRVFYWNTILIVFTNVGIAVAFYLLLLPLHSDLALVCFMTAIMPSATASPAMARFLKQNVEYVTVSVILTNSIISLSIPFLIAGLIHPKNNVSTPTILISVSTLIFAPLLLAQITKFLYPSINYYGPIFKNLSFYIWNFLIFIASASATHFIVNQSKATPQMLAAIAACSLLICILNFWVGRLIGGKQFAREASQSLGHKNTMFSVWISLSFLNPIAAIGPMFYVLYQNLYNCYQLAHAQEHSSMNDPG
ncbi:MAG: hypothetical protein ACM37W_08410 [Actinomycetota bacterium]